VAIETAFLAYRHTGEDPAKLEPMLKGAVEALGTVGVETYCTFFTEEHFKAKQYNPRAIMEHAFERIEKRDALLVIQASNDKSEGMILEIGKFFGVKPIIFARHVDANDTYLPEMADHSFDWATQEELESGFIEAVSKFYVNTLKPKEKVLGLCSCECAAPVNEYKLALLL
jgi:hypothetical protein